MFCIVDDEEKSDEVVEENEKDGTGGAVQDLKVNEKKPIQDEARPKEESQDVNASEGIEKNQVRSFIVCLIIIYKKYI